MTSRSKGPTKAPQESINDEFDPLAALNGAIVESFTQACQAYASGVTTLNAELMGFANTRASRDVDLGEALSKCENWSDAVGLQQDWAQQVWQEYLAEASRLVELSAKIAQGNWVPVYERANRAFSTINRSVS